MASNFNTVWAIDVGNNTLKALRLGITDSGGIEVLDFDTIQHGKILTGVGIRDNERDELVAISLRRLLEQRAFGKDPIATSVSSQNSFARFVNLPPVEQKRIPEIVRFEATQQIPFDISEVQWDWQLIGQPGESETKIGIFAIKTEVVESLLEYFTAEDLSVTFVQMAPMALYNYILYDNDQLQKAGDQAVIVLDIGAENTDLVVCTGSAVWQRCIPMGGNAFTKAIANAFKISFEKAEKLKRTAPMSKYARQIFHAMRPVYSELASEVQRSLNFYTNSNPAVKLSKVVAMGGGTRMRGLLKYLRQTLQIPVEKPDLFNKLAMGPGVSQAKFHENVADFGVVYGLGVQALGAGKIESNLIPKSVARSVAWANKAKYFTAAALMLLLVSVMTLARTSLDKMGYDNERNETLRREVASVIAAAQRAESELRTFETKGRQYEKLIASEFEPFAYRNVVPLLYQTIIEQLPNEKNNPQQAHLYQAFANRDVEKIVQIPRKKRKQLFVTNMSMLYATDVVSMSVERAGFIKSGKRKKEKEKEQKDREFELKRRMEEYKALGLGTAELEFEMLDYGLPGLTTAGELGKPGFVVSIAGYSPYENMRELLDPDAAETDPNKWGFVTRLLHLDELTPDGNCPFELYDSSPGEHFRLEWGWVNVDSEEMPAGIGVFDTWTPEIAQTAAGSSVEEMVLVDPMTREIISEVPVLDEQGKPKYNSSGEKQYEKNDCWFVLRLKFVWKDAPGAKTDQGTATSSARKPF